MKKSGYLKRLRRALKGVPKEDAEGVVSYCSELIDDGVERGKTEAEVCAELDPPETVAENYIRENGTGKANERTGGAASVATLPLRILGCIVGVVLIIVLAALVFAFAVSAIALFLAGIYAVVVSFGLFPENSGLAFVQIGTGIVLIGTAVLFILLVQLAAGLLGACARWMGRGFRSGGTQHAKKRGYLSCLAVGLSFFALGIVVSVSAFGGMGFDSEKLVVANGLVLQEQTVTAEVSEINVDMRNSAVSVEKSDGDLTVSYYDWDGSTKEFSVEDGVLTLTETENDAFFSAWEHGIFWGAFAAKYNEVVVRLPDGYSGTLNLKTLNGTIATNHITCETLNLETLNGAVAMANTTAETATLSTQNGMVVVSDSTSGKLHAQTQNGAVLLTRCTAGSMIAKTENGAITLGNVAGTDMEFETSNGEISGSIVGKRSDFHVTADVGLGACNIQNGGSGEKSLRVETGLGMILISFTED